MIEEAKQCLDSNRHGLFLAQFFLVITFYFEIIEALIISFKSLFYILNSNLREDVEYM